LEVAELASAFARIFGWEGAARATGLLHDAGKASAEFQAYIQGVAGSVDHSTTGARVANGLYQGSPGRLLALCIAGHHAGLADAEDLDRRLDPLHPIPNASDWIKHITAPSKADLRPSRTFSGSNADTIAFTQAFVVRMLFSCLVDADFLATEAFMSGGAVERGIRIGMDRLRDRLSVHMESLRRNAEPTELNGLRAEILDHVVAKAGEQPGFFTLTVPTGGGKTLASLAFALHHACLKQKRRVIYVIPFTSIIEQTADVFRNALGPEPVLEHHSSFDWETAAPRACGRDGGDERDRLGVLRRAAENWDAPIVVTTAVQFFESLFANRTSACRKLHNIADSVIVLDEAQTLPQRFLLPCLAALDELTRNYGVSVVLCTATQPALRRQDGALQDGRGRPLGLDIPETRELAPRPIALYQALKRVAVEVLPGSTTDETVAARFAQAPQMLCIVNSRAHTRALFDRLAHLPGAAHLTTLMCPAHRRQVLAGLRADLKAGRPVRLVATSLIEAGIDISFPEVWRSMAGVDSIAQAAGRCNREGELLPNLGRVVVFTPAEGRTPEAFRLPQQAAHGVLRDHADDPLSLEAVGAFFRQLWFQKGAEALDGAKIGDRPGRGVLAALRETALNCRFPFQSIAEAFRLIDDIMRPVVVPWNDEAKAALETVAAATVLPRDALRKLQQFTVGIPSTAYDAWLAAGVIVQVRRELGDTLLRFADLAHYRPATGVDLADTTRREAEQNVW
jgi:CRISPR-associated endonuclease/helicase Cas3